MSSLFISTFIVAFYLAASAQQLETRLQYTVTEQQIVGTLVADVAGDSKIQVTPSTRFIIVNKTRPNQDLFNIDDRGLLRTSAVIDRDVICPQKSACPVLLDVAVQQSSDVVIVKLQVEILDLNDNPPSFSAASTSYNISESTPVGILFPLPVATDLDSPPNGVVGYRLTPPSDTFAIQVQNSTTGIIDVRLVLVKSLDSQRQSHYSFQLTAVDGGRPQLSASILVDVYVMSSGQNAPQFDSSVYRVNLPSNTTLGTAFVRLHAAVPGSTADVIRYAFSTRSQTLYGHVFAINSTSGDVTLLSAVDQGSYNISVEATALGSNQVPGFAALAITVQFINDQPPTVTINPRTDSDRPEVAAGSPSGTFVAHVSATDTINRVTCSLADDTTSGFRLLMMLDGEYKILTTRVFYSGAYYLEITCQDDGTPPLTTRANLTVIVTSVDLPVFTQPVYNVTVASDSSASTFVMCVNASNSAVVNTAAISYSLDGRSAERFYVESTTGAIYSAAAMSGSVEFIELRVIARNVYNLTSVAMVLVYVVNPAQLEFLESPVACSVLENLPAGAKVCDLQGQTNLSPENVFHYGLVGAAGFFRIDAVGGEIYTNASLDREFRSQYQLVLRVQLKSIPAQVLNVHLSVDVLDVNDNAPSFVFPTAANNTVTVVVDGLLHSTSTPSGTRLPQLPVAVVMASDADSGLNGHVSYSLLRNGTDARYFEVSSLTGQIYLDATIDDLIQLINRTCTLYVQATDAGRPSTLQTVSVLHVNLVTSAVTDSSTPPSAAGSQQPTTSPSADSKLVILASVIATFFVVVILVVVALCVICRKTRFKNREPTMTGDVFWARVHMEPSSQSSVNSTSPPSSLVDRKFPETPLDAGGLRAPKTAAVPVDVIMTNNYIQTRLSGQPLQSLQPLGVVTTGGGEQDDDSGCAGFSNSTASSSSEEGGGDSKRSSKASDIGGSTELTAIAVHRPEVTGGHFSPVPDWLRTSFRATAATSATPAAAAAPIDDSTSTLTSTPTSSSAAILRRTGSTCSRKSVRFADAHAPEQEEVVGDAKKRVHFAAENQLQYVSANVTAATGGSLDDVIDDDDEVGDGASEMSYTNSDCSSGLYVINCGGYRVGGASGTTRPPIVAFRTFLPQDGSLV